METLRFKVEKQHIEYIPPHSYLVAGTQNYLDCDFQFDASGLDIIKWLHLNRNIMFRYLTVNVVFLMMWHG